MRSWVLVFLLYDYHHSTITQTTVADMTVFYIVDYFQEPTNLHGLVHWERK